MISARQRDVLKFIVRYQKKEQRPPSRTEISKKFGWASANAAQSHLVKLRDEGMIKLQPNLSRGIKVTERGTKEIS